MEIVRIFLTVAALGLILALAIVVVLQRRRLRIQEIFVLAVKGLAGENSAYLLPPEIAVFRGASFNYGRRQSRGVLLASHSRVMFYYFDGRRIEIPLADIRQVTGRRFFLGAGGGRHHLVITLYDTNEIGFYVQNVDEWVDILAARDTPPPPHDPFRPPPVYSVPPKDPKLLTREGEVPRWE